MKNDDQRQKLVTYLKARRFATSEEISTLLGISLATARRLTATLEKERVIQRFHGGVILEGAGHDIRHVDNLPTKRKIAQYACSHFIKDGDTVYIGSGNTPGLMGEFLYSFKELTIITNNLLLLPYITALPHIRTIFTGGFFNPYMPSMVGEVYPLKAFSDNFIINSCFVTSPAVSNQGCSQQETYIRQVVEEHFISLEGTIGYLLADTGKLGLNKSFRWATPDKFSHLITDTQTPESKKLEQMFSILYCDE
ncbi:MAG: DeoR/GlpR family DNA-binding transcription regulator [Brevinema sp.]